MSGKLTLSRHAVFSASAALIWLIFSLPPLILNNPDAFQASGSIIVAWAVLFYARDRARRENEIVKAQRQQLVAILDEHDAWGDYHAVKSKIEFQEHELRHLKLLKSLGHAASGETGVAEQIAELEADLADRSALEKLRIRREAKDREAKDAAKRAEATARHQGPAAKLLSRLELVLIVYGTLQWGYGDKWVGLVHGSG